MKRVPIRLAGAGTRGGFITASAGLAAALLLGRATGLLRESMIAARFGLSTEGDAAAVLLSLPDVLVSLLLAGGMSAALVPRLARATDAEAAALVRIVAAVSVLIFGALGLLLALAPELVFGIFAPGSHGVARVPSTLALVATAAALPVVALSGVTGAWLNARGRFWAVGLGTLLFNCGIIGALLGRGPGTALVTALGCGVLAGSLLRWSIQLHGLPWRSIIYRAAKADHLRPFFAAFLAGLAATTIALLPPIILRAMASFLGEGQLVGLYYAQKLVELPVGVVLSSLSTVALTALSASFAESGLQPTRNEATVHLRRASLLGLLVAIFGASMAPQIVEIVFGYGRVGPEGIAMIARLFAIGVFALPFAALALIAGNFLYATHRPRAAVLPAVGGLVATAVCAVPALNLGDPRYLMVASVVGQAFLALGMLARGRLLTRWAGAGGAATATGSWMARALVASIPLALALWLAVGSASAGSIAQVAIGGSGLLAACAIVVCEESRDMTKRLFDVAVSVFGLVLAAPVMAAIALAIFMRDGRPVIFRQIRVGRNARPFEILKFRTMLRNAQASGGISTAAGDPRITQLGRFLRKTSLDELPQLINVLRGEMSLVGPRPDTPQQEQDYAPPDWRARCSVRPGITGLAQASLRSSATPEQRLALDLQYASNPSLLRDLKILGKTFAQVIAKGGI